MIMTTAIRRAPPGLLVPLLLTGCTSDTPPAPGVRDLALPVAPGSAYPHLEAAADGIWMSWTEPSSGGHRIRIARLDPDALASVAAAGGAADARPPGEDAADGSIGAASPPSASLWSVPATVTEADNLFVNWADFPSVRAFDDRIFVHWLQRGGDASYDYGVRIAWSDDGGAHWSPPLIPHDDGTPTEHGFVSFFEEESALWAAWLDGRAMIEPEGPMSLRARPVAFASPPSPHGSATAPPPPGSPDAQGMGPERVVDDMTCECCQTDAAVAEGVPLIVYRDRAEGEIRDIFLSRRSDGRWLPGHPVYTDGWVIGGCPVNGPAISARNALVAVAWFTAPDDRPRVQVSLSHDGARTFAAPVRIDEGHPIGRVDVVFLDDGAAFVTWLEDDPAASAGTPATIFGRRIPIDGPPGPALALASSSSLRASGFPRIASLDPDRIILAWTDPATGVRARIVRIP